MSNRYETGACDERPWGSWSVIDSGEHYTVKRIRVKPKARLSLQYHHHRQERWTVVQGRGKVQIGEEVAEIAFADSVSIPLKARHRIENTGEEDLIFIEVQMGELLSEDDIVRLSDDYGRG